MRVEPFTTSILDGIDLRETIRKWYEGAFMCASSRRSSGEVGSVVVIFDEDRDNRYSYMTTWLGENQNESDMAFYSTFPFDNLVGPGIGRGEYGGFLMSLPARRMYDVWQDPDYEFAESKSERLLMAALDYSIHRHVVYVAAKPPRTIFQDHRRPPRTHHHVHPHRAALARIAKEDPRRARAGRLRQARNRQRLHSLNQATGSRLRTFAESVVRLSPSISAAAFLFPPVLRSACSRMLRSITASVCS